MKKITCIGVKEDGRPFRVVNGKLLTEELNALPKGRYRLTVDKYYKKASHEQFKYLYGLVYPLSMVALNGEVSSASSTPCLVFWS